MSNSFVVPTFSGTINQDFFVDRLGGPQHPLSLLDRFPDELYNKTLDSHLVRFLYALLGPAGVGLLQKQLLELRLEFEAHGLQLFDLEGFYGNPFSFGRILDEYYDPGITDPTLTLADRQAWDIVRAQDERYRSRAIDFLNGARAGNTPFGMRLVARSGLGHDVDIIENYKYLFSLHTDEPFPIPYVGQTDKTEEFVVVPRREMSRSSVQTIEITGTPTSGTYELGFNGSTATLLYTDNFFDVQVALGALNTIQGNVVVTPKIGTALSFVVTFVGALSNRSVPLITATSFLNGSPPPTISVKEVVGGSESLDEGVYIGDADQHHLTVALDLIRPVNTLFSTNLGTGLRSRQLWNTAQASSEYSEVIRYVTGNPGVNWPPVDAVHWIVVSNEEPAPRAFADLQHHYVNFHDFHDVTAYTNYAVDDPDYLADSGILAKYPSEHLGSFDPVQVANDPILHRLDDPDHRFKADILANTVEPRTMTTQISTSEGNVQLINGIYPSDYLALSGVPQIVDRGSHLWISVERKTGDEYLEIDLGELQFVNFISFEVSKKPLNIDISYDVLNQPPRRRFNSVTPINPLDFPSAIAHTPDETVGWYATTYHFSDAIGNIPLTRFIRLRFSRVTGGLLPYLFDPVTKVQSPWCIEVRNLRVGRNISA